MSAPRPPSASDAPVRELGTRARSGNTMAQTRAALLQATASCIARYGVRKTTMVDVASRSGVAKATLYNHFRTKDDVLEALVEQQVQALVATALRTVAEAGLQAALEEAAQVLTTSAALVKVAADEPGALAPLLRPDDGRGWTAARDGVAALLAAARVPADPAQVELVLRWFTSQLLWPVEHGAAALLAGLGGLSGMATAPQPPPQPAGSAAAPAGLGWPTAAVPAPRS